MKRLFLILALTLPAAWATAAQPMSEEETLQVLDRIAAKRADGAIQSDFREEKKLAMMEKPVVETGTLAFLAPNKFRREVPGKSLTVCDGETLWMYYPVYKEAEKYTLTSNKALRESLSAMTSGLGLRDLAKNYTVKAERDADGYTIELTPRSRAMRGSVQAITLMIGTDLKARRMVLVSGPNESSTITFSNERKASLSPDDFSFKPPSGVTVSEPLGR